MPLTIDLSKCVIFTRPIAVERFGQESNRFLVVRSPTYDVMKDTARKDAILECALARVPFPPIYAYIDRGERYNIIRGGIFFEVLRDFVAGRIEITSPKLFETIKPGSRFEGLSKNLQKRIIETNMTFNLIELNAPQEFIEEVYKFAVY